MIDLRTNNIPAEMAGSAVEHGHFGIFCMCGPGIKQGKPIYGSLVRVPAV